MLLDVSIRTLFFGGLSMLAYAAAIERARSWGSLIKAAVDLYRRALVKQLEYTYSYADVTDERQRFWTRLSSWWGFPDMRDSLEKVPFAPSAPIVVTSASSANDVPLAIVRGVSSPAGKPYATTTVTLRLQNIGAEAASSLTIRDPVPPAWSFVWGSLTRVGGGTAPKLKSTSPLECELDVLAKNAACDVTYQLQSLIQTP